MSHGPLPLPAAILFDLDGTLVDTVGTRAAAWLEAFHDHGIPASLAHVAPLMGADGRWVASEVARVAGMELDAAGMEKVDHLAGEHFDRLNHSPRALDGATELLLALDAARRRWAIATSSRPGQVRASIDALGLARPPRVTDGSHVQRAKPEPDLLLAAARELGAAPAACWYVGDSRWDMLAARAAGMTAIGIATGALDEVALAEAGAHRTHASLRAFRDALDAADGLTAGRY